MSSSRILPYKLINLIITTAGALIALAACGGGGGGGGDSERPMFAGRYLLSPQTLVEDSCSLGLPSTLSDTIIVSVEQDLRGLNLEIHTGDFLPLITSQGLVAARRNNPVFIGSLNEERNGFLVATNELREEQCVSVYSI